MEGRGPKLIAACHTDGRVAEVGQLLSKPLETIRWIRMAERADDYRRVRPQPVTCTWNQARDRSDRYLRRQRDKERFVLNAGVAVVMAALAAWWVVPVHSFSGRVLWIVSPGHGVHVGDLPAFVFAAVALVCSWFALRALERLAS
jgi:hypothetical protein